MYLLLIPVTLLLLASFMERIANKGESLAVASLAGVLGLVFGSAAVMSVLVVVPAIF